MRIFKTALIFTFLLAFTFNISAQTPKWVKMMNDPSVNFFDVEKEANNYFKDKDKGKGSGWKQFQRWKYFTEQRFYPTGDRSLSEAGIAWKEILKFKDKYSGKDSRSLNPWTELGPHTSAVVTGHWSPGIGRIDAIAVDPLNDSIIYCGSPSGGLWKSIDAGASWTALTDYLPIIGISSIAIDPGNTDIVYIATGDKDAGQVYSIGVLKSLDGGATWNTTGLDWTISQSIIIHKLIIHPNNPDILFATSSDGIFKTQNSGQTWVNVLNNELEDIEFKPGEPLTVYGVSNSTFYKSTDGGNSFTTVNVNISDRAQIAVTQANSDYVYLVSAGSGIFRSTDSGSSFSYRGPYPDQGNVSWYALSAAASHSNAEQLHVGEFETWVSNNGGLSFTKTSEWTWGNSVGYVHCDIHEMVFKAGTIYCGSDGLITKSSDGGLSWINLSEGIGTRQFYRIACSATQANTVMGGAQDNGTSIMTNGSWHEWLGADGMDCVIDWNNPDIVYGTTQNGNFYKSSVGGSNANDNIAQPGGGGWITPLVMDYTNPAVLYVGNNQIMKTTNGMLSWTSIGNFGSGNVDALAVAPSNSNYIYASKNELIWMTSNGGVSWTEITGNLPLHNITYITVHPSNPQKIAISMSGYTNNEKVYVSNDGGTTWINFSGNLPNLPANCLVYQNSSQDGLYVGMDVGVYYRDNTLTNWLDYFTDLPNVIISELEIQEASGKIRAGTFGRGLWEADLFNSVPAPAFLLQFVDITNDDNGNAIPDPGESFDININANNYGNLASLPATVTLTATGANSNYITINTIQNNLGVLNPSDVISSSHNITVDSQTSLETEIDLLFTISDGTNSSELHHTIVISQPPAYTMTNTDNYACFGYVYDSGGELGNYANYEDYTMIIYPVDSNRNIILDFTMFDVEFQANCNYDYLKIFDGTSIFDPLIGEYCGTNSPGTVEATNSNGALCLVFHADEYVTEAGWKAGIACNPPIGVSELDDVNKIIIHSNPTTGLFNVEIQDNSGEDIELSIVNSLGQIVKQMVRPETAGRNILIDISNQPDGVYFLKIKTLKRNFSSKIVLSR